MHVWPARFHCFGCGEHGDVFDLLALSEPRWVKRLQMVAQYVGVPMPVRERKRSDNKRLKEALA
jgi:DNA primase